MLLQSDICLQDGASEWIQILWVVSAKLSLRSKDLIRKRVKKEKIGHLHFKRREKANIILVKTASTVWIQNSITHHWHWPSGVINTNFRLSALQTGICQNQFVVSMSYWAHELHPAHDPLVARHLRSSKILV